MWSEARSIDTGQAGQTGTDRPGREKLLVARLRMQEALRLLDEHSMSAAAASLDMAIHQLDRELSGH